MAVPRCGTAWKSRKAGRRALRYPFLRHFQRDARYSGAQKDGRAQVRHGLEKPQG